MVLYTVLVQKVAPPLKLFAIFSLMVNLCNWNYLGYCPTMSYEYTTFGPLIWIFLWIV